MGDSARPGSGNLQTDGGSAVDIPEPDVDELEALDAKSEEQLDDSEVTSKIKLSIKRRFDFPTWVTVFEFTNRDGKRADCLAFNCRPSRNFPLVGFEFKASRSDWLSEKKDHEKADLFVQFCDEWYVVAGRRGIVKEEELPDGWGLLELKPSGQLWKLVESDLGEMQSRGLDRRFYTRFIRKAIGTESNFDYSDIKEAQRRGYEEAQEKEVEKHLSLKEERLKEKADAFDELKDAGLAGYRSVSEEKIERLKTAEEIVERTKTDGFASFEGRVDSFEREIERMVEELDEYTDEMRDALADLREPLGGEP